MILVLDTSAAAEMVLNGKRASGIQGHFLDAEWVISPTLYISEISNVFWKYYQFNKMPLDACESGLDHALSLPDEFCRDHELCREAFALSCLTGKPVYDMFYLVAARRYNGSLLTLDSSLKRTAEKHAIRTL